MNKKIIVITGAGKGLGKEIALKLASSESVIVLLSRTESDLQEVKSEIEKVGFEANYIVCDVGNEESVKKTFFDIFQKYGKVDVLVNNAGVWFEGFLEEHPDEIIRKVFDVVTLGTIFCSKAVIPEMKEKKSGIIMNINSIAGIATPGESGQYSVYTAAKHAVTGFTKSLSEELKGTGVKVLGFHPGGMNTEIFKSAGFKYADNEDWMMNKTDVANIVAFILSQPYDVEVESIVIRKFNS